MFGSSRAEQEGRGPPDVGQRRPTAGEKSRAPSDPHMKQIASRCIKKTQEINSNQSLLHILSQLSHSHQKRNIKQMDLLPANPCCISCKRTTHRARGNCPHRSRGHFRSARHRSARHSSHRRRGEVQGRRGRRELRGVFQAAVRAVPAYAGVGVGYSGIKKTWLSGFQGLTFSKSSI